MAKFHDELAAMIGAENAHPEAQAIAQRLTAAYDDDFTIPAAKVTSLEGIIKKQGEDISGLKVTNFDLLMKTGASTKPEPKTVEGKENEEIGIADLF